MCKEREVKKASELLDKQYQQITQEQYDKTFQMMLDKIDNEKEKAEHLKLKNGGNCFFCEKPYEKTVFKNALADYECFVPSCDCLENKKKKLQKEKLFNRLYIDAEIPNKFIRKDFKDISKSTPDSLKQNIRVCYDYLKKELYRIQGIIILGSIGTGKTHIATSILKKLIRIGKKCLFVNTSDFVSKCMGDKNYVDYLVSFDVLLFDDIDKLSKGKNDDNSWIHERLFSLFNGITNNYRTIIATSNKKIDELGKSFNATITSRLFGACKVVEFKGEDWRIKENNTIVNG